MTLLGADCGCTSNQPWPTSTNRKRWREPPVSVEICTFVPLVVKPPLISSTFVRACCGTNLKYPLPASTGCHFCQALLFQFWISASVPSAVPPFLASMHLLFAILGVNR